MPVPARSDAWLRTGGPATFSGGPRKRADPPSKIREQPSLPTGPPLSWPMDRCLHKPIRHASDPPYCRRKDPCEERSLPLSRHMPKSTKGSLSSTSLRWVPDRDWRISSTSGRYQAPAAAAAPRVSASHTVVERPCCVSDKIHYEQLADSSSRGLHDGGHGTATVSQPVQLSSPPATIETGANSKSEFKLSNWDEQVAPQPTTVPVRGQHEPTLSEMDMDAAWNLGPEDAAPRSIMTLVDDFLSGEIAALFVPRDDAEIVLCGV